MDKVEIVKNDKLINGNFKNYFIEKLLDYFQKTYRVKLLPELMKINFSGDLGRVSGEGDFINEYMTGKFQITEYLLINMQDRSVRTKFFISYENMSIEGYFEICLFYDEEIELIQNENLDVTINEGNYLIEIEVFNLDLQYDKYDYKFIFYDYYLSSDVVKRLKAICEFDDLGFKIVNGIEEELLELVPKKYEKDPYKLKIKYVLNDLIELNLDDLKKIINQVINSYKNEITLNEILNKDYNSWFILTFNFNNIDRFFRKDFRNEINNKILESYKVSQIIYLIGE